MDDRVQRTPYAEPNKMRHATKDDQPWVIWLCSGPIIGLSPAYEAKERAEALVELLTAYEAKEREEALVELLTAATAQM